MLGDLSLSGQQGGIFFSEDSHLLRPEVHLWKDGKRKPVLKRKEEEFREVA